MSQTSTPSARLFPIEGLRAYLALWVVLSHVMQWSGFPEQGLSGLWLWARQGFLPVKVFMIISGFVIMHRLEVKRETTGVFLFHRFFRIYPLYLLLFLLCIPLSAEGLWAGLPAESQISAIEPAYTEWAANPVLHVLLHVFMLHGFPPESLVPASQYAFLPPAWSIALEFQFYLVAPFIFLLLNRGTPRARALLYGGCLAVLVLANRKLFLVLNPLSLPFFWTYFLTGVVSYYAFRLLRGKTSWPLFACLALVLFKISDQSFGVFPLVAWLLFFGLLLEETPGAISRLLLPLFNHGLPQYLGRISYSIYLCHWPALVVAHLALARLGWAGTGTSYLALLLVITLFLTLLASVVLYHGVEKPGIALGNKLAARLFPARPLPAALAKATS